MCFNGTYEYVCMHFYIVMVVAGKRFCFIRINEMGFIEKSKNQLVKKCTQMYSSRGAVILVSTDNVAQKQNRTATLFVGNKDHLKQKKNRFAADRRFVCTNLPVYILYPFKFHTSPLS